MLVFKQLPPFLHMQTCFPGKLGSNLTLGLRAQSPPTASANPYRVWCRDSANTSANRGRKGERGGRLSLNSQCFKQNQGLTGSASKSTHQVDEVLVADPPLRVAVCQGQQDLQLVGVQLRAVPLEKGAELLSADVAGVVGIKLGEEGKMPELTIPHYTQLCPPVHSSPAADTQGPRGYSRLCWHIPL